MADKILFQNKEKLIDNNLIPDKNKVTANDMNEIKEVVNGHADNIEELETNKADRSEIPTDLSELSNESTKFVNETQLAIAIQQETTARQNADVELQNQIDSIVAQSDVVDIVGTYQELLSYDTSKLTENDIIKVLSDSTHNNATSYFRWTNNSWAYVGNEGPYYTKGETDERLNQKANQSSLNETNQNVSALSGRVGTNESDIRDIKAEQITQNTQIATLIADSGNKIELSINSTNYVMTATLKNKAGTVLNTSSIDLPLEAMIVNVTYDTATKELVLTLQNGTSLRVSIADIVSGLVSQDDFDDLEVRVENLEGDVADIKEEQETQNTEIEELQEQVETLTNTVESELEDGTATGESISVTDSANAPAKLLPSGNTFQQQYEGYNLCTVQGQNNVVIASVLAGTYTFSFSSTEAGSVGFNIYENATSGTRLIKDANIVIGRNSVTFTVENDCNIYLNGYAITSGKAFTDIISEYQLEQGSTAHDYEPYTGGQASPSPEYPQTIHNVSGHNEFLIQNKNIFNLTANDFKNGETLGVAKKVVLTLEPNTYYTLSSNEAEGTALATNIWFNGNSSITDGVGINRAKTKMTDENGQIFIAIRTTEIDTVFANYWFQLEKGTTATSYVTHEENTAEFTLEEGQKMFLGDYLADDGTHHVQGEMILTGTERWLKASSNRFYLTLSANSYKKNMSQTCLSNYFIGQNFVANNSGQVNAGCVSFYGYPSGQSWEMYINYDENATLEEFKQFLADKYSNGNPVKVQYPLYAEVIEPYTELQQQQYSRLKKMMSYYQQTNVNTITAGDLAPILNFEYKKSNNIRIKTLEKQNELILNRLALLEN